MREMNESCRVGERARLRLIEEIETFAAKAIANERCECLAMRLLM